MVTPPQPPLTQNQGLSPEQPTPIAPIVVATTPPIAPSPEQAKTDAALAARAAAQAAQARVLSRQQSIADLCVQQFLRIEEMAGAAFSHRGTCAKCGWQSMQHTKEDAYDMVTKHVMQHWKDVVGML